MISLNDIFNSLKWVVLGSAIVFTILFALFPTAEAQAKAVSYNGISLIQYPEIDTSFVVTILWAIWSLIILSQISWKMLKVDSDRIIMDGINQPNSCIASELHPKNDLGFIRVGGSKLLPDIKGSSAYIAPLTHIHKIGTTVWIEAHAAPELGLDTVPPDVIEDIYQQRNGLFGIKTCSPGFLSSKELTNNTVFNGGDYDDAEGDDRKMWTTTTFISYIMSLNKGVAGLYDLFLNDTSSIEKKLASIKSIGRAAGSQQNKNIVDHFIVSD